MTQRRCLLAALVLVAGCYNHPFEVCNGLDDDDDPQTVDGLEDPLLGGECDGPDADLCGEGSLVCANGAITCNDETSDNIEVCNNEDDDCDSVVDEMFDVETDVENCGACGQACTNPNGAVACAAGVCMPTCDVGAVDCNANPMDGCEVFRDRDPSCEVPDGVDDISGDESGFTAFLGTDEGIYEVTLREVSTASTPVRAQIELDVPPGLDFDLYVYCDACGGAIAGSSRNGPGMREIVDILVPDRSNVNDDETIYIEVRFVSETTCGDEWSLTVTGNSGLATASVCQ